MNMKADVHTEGRAHAIVDELTQKQTQTYPIRLHAEAPPRRRTALCFMAKVDAADGVKDALLEAYGSALDVWDAIDVTGSGRAYLFEFQNTCQHFGSKGNLQAVFAEIDR